MSNKPEFNDSDLTRWQEALASGSSLRFEQGSAALLIHTPQELETFLQLDPGTITPSKETSEHETVQPIVLSPGSAVYRADGMLPAIIEGGESAPVWCLPGDFQRYLQPGEPETRASGLVREILVGSYRNPADDDNDDPAYIGTFIPDSEWDAVVGDVHRECLQLRQLIGELPEGAHPDEIKPRAASFMAERANWETEVAALRASESELRTTVADITARNAELLTSAVETAPGLPADARKKLVGIKGVSEKLADEILAALTSPATTD